MNHCPKCRWRFLAVIRGKLMVHVRRRIRHCWLLVIAGFAMTACARAAEPPADVDFDRDVLPILTAQCLKCHGSESLKAGLDLRTSAMILKVGRTGRSSARPPPTVPSSPA
jgi:hypothetical protein